MDFNSLRYKCCTGLVLLPGAEFQAAGKAKLGSFFTNSTRWGVHIDHQHYEALFLDFFLYWLATFQFFEVETVHEFDARIFNKLVQRQDFEFFKQRCRMGSEGGITDYAYGLFLLNYKFFQVSGIFTSINVNAISDI
jgi:hypothetical protein